MRSFKKLILTNVVFICSFFNTLVFAQDSTVVSPNDTVQTPMSEPLPSKLSSLSAKPSARELADFLGGASKDAEDATTEVAKLGEDAVPGLSELLFSATLQTITPVGRKKGAVLPIDRFTVVKMLATIDNEVARATLAQAVNSDKDYELGAFALYSLANCHHDNTWRTGQTPTTQVLRLLINALDDQRHIPRLRKRMSQVAQEGLLLWLGLDFGDPQFSVARKEAGFDGREASAGEYAKLWLGSNMSKLVWNDRTGHFEVQ